MCIQLFIWDDENKLKQSKLLYIQLSIWDSIIYTFSMNRFIVYNKQTNTTNNNNNNHNENSNNKNWSLTSVSSPRVDQERAYLSKTRDEFSFQCNNNVYSISHSLFLYLISILNEHIAIAVATTTRKRIVAIIKM